MATLTGFAGGSFINQPLAGAGPDTTPDQFTFVDQSSVARGATITSAAIIVTGIDTAADITITGGTYSINGGGYTASAGTVNNGDSVTVRHTSSASYSTATNTALTIGGVSDTFTSTTLVDPAAVMASIGGTAVASDGIMQTLFLEDAEPVPGTAVLINGIAHAQAGQRYVCAWPASGTVYYSGAIARRADGAMCILNAGSAVTFRGGWGMTARGEVVASTSPAQVVLGGFGIRSNGQVCMSEAA